ncbi:hypothetical protein BYT27DRAFT_7265148 [Phlegmacium glaucopus]|nr:hypothetical protein BYT27DRAFT_7265148 [Phlegmacium glaucopus]
MSLRIKLPALKPPLSPTPTIMESKRKRKRTQRYVGLDDDLVGETDLATETSVVDKHRRQDSLLANSDIDVVGEDDYDQDDQPSEPSNHIIAKPTKSKPKGKATGDGPPARKKSRRVVASDPETEDEYLDVALDSGHEFEDGDENDHFPPDLKLTTKSLKGKGKASVNTSGKGGAKRKAKVDTPEVPTISKKRPKPTPKSDGVSINVVGDGSSTPNVDRPIHTISKPDSPPPSATSQQPPPRKQKLPTIKKVKLPALNTPTSTIVKDTVALPLGSKPTQDGVRKTLTGATDIDLSNKSIYEEIFSKTGQGDGGTPRAGGNRRTKEEERRKELNRQRDEAKAKRALEARQTFDLQAQFDRISRFEDKLKAEHSSALFPNFLAAKWREDWEKEKRRHKGKDWHDSIYSHESTAREEGEVR